MILYNGQQAGGSGDFISFGLNKGIPEFRFDVGAGPAIIQGDRPIDMGKWHTIKLSRNKKDGSMVVDGQVTIFNVQTIDEHYLLNIIISPLSFRINQRFGENQL